MHILLIFHGKTRNRELDALIGEYIKRANHYARVETLVIPELKNIRGRSTEWIKEQEDLALLKHLGPRDGLVLLDEKGESLSSRQFSDYLARHSTYGQGRLCFAIGGPFGFGPKARELAKGELSLSKMTFSHEMARLFFAEQLYRAFSIQRNESYHHD